MSQTRGPDADFAEFDWLSLLSIAIVSTRDEMHAVYPAAHAWTLLFCKMSEVDWQ